jgi:hypothetical protein
MKTIYAFLFALVYTSATAQEYKVITSVENLGTFNPSGIVDHKDTLDHKNYVMEMVDRKAAGDIDKKNKPEIHKFQHIKLMDLNAGLGIEPQNVASNDATISSKLTEMAKQKWQLVFVSSAIESDAGEKDGKALLITRYIFKR